MTTTEKRDILPASKTVDNQLPTNKEAGKRKLKKRTKSSFPSYDDHRYKLLIQAPPAIDTTLLEKRRYLVCPKITISGNNMFGRKYKNQMTVFHYFVNDAIPDFKCVSIELADDSWLVKIESEEMEPYKKLDELIQQLLEPLDVLFAKLNRKLTLYDQVVTLDVRLSM